ncbi:MAG: hypothetical protein V4510_02675 [bacterium]
MSASGQQLAEVLRRPIPNWGLPVALLGAVVVAGSAFVFSAHHWGCDPTPTETGAQSWECSGRTASGDAWAVALLAGGMVDWIAGLAAWAIPRARQVQVMRDARTLLLVARGPAAAVDPRGLPGRIRVPGWTWAFAGAMPATFVAANAIPTSSFQDCATNVPAFVAACGQVAGPPTAPVVALGIALALFVGTIAALERAGRGPKAELASAVATLI